MSQKNSVSFYKVIILDICHRSIKLIIMLFLKMFKSQSGLSLGSRANNLKKSHMQSMVFVLYLREEELFLFKLLRLITIPSVSQIRIIG